MSGFDRASPCSRLGDHALEHLLLGSCLIALRGLAFPFRRFDLFELSSGRRWIVKLALCLLLDHLAEPNHPSNRQGWQPGDQREWIHCWAASATTKS